MTHRPGALAGIGNTPLVKLSALPGDGAADIWVKLEAANPTGSYKDRMALAMIEGARGQRPSVARADGGRIHRRLDGEFVGSHL